MLLLETPPALTLLLQPLLSWPIFPAPQSHQCCRCCCSCCYCSYPNSGQSLLIHYHCCSGCCCHGHSSQLLLLDGSSREMIWWKDDVKEARKMCRVLLPRDLFMQGAVKEFFFKYCRQYQMGAQKMRSLGRWPRLGFSLLISPSLLLALTTLVHSGEDEYVADVCHLQVVQAFLS